MARWTRERIPAEGLVLHAFPRRSQRQSLQDLGVISPASEQLLCPSLCLCSVVAPSC